MKTEEEIIKFTKNLFGSSVRVSVSRLYDDYVTINVGQSYEYLNIQFKDLKAFSEFFGTDNINIANGCVYKGCDTCDYGSYYEICLTVGNKDG